MFVNDPLRGNQNKEKLTAHDKRQPRHEASLWLATFLIFSESNDPNCRDPLARDCKQLRHGLSCRHNGAMWSRLHVLI